MLKSMLILPLIVLGACTGTDGTPEDTDTAVDTQTDTDTDWLAPLTGTVYAQALGVGWGSYHFAANDNIYIDYFAAGDAWKDDAGNALSPQKLFIGTAFDVGARTFTGTLDWSDPEGVTVEDMEVWAYTMIFSEDYATIEDGGIEAFDASGASMGQVWAFPDDLSYTLVDGG